jgi:hypothetical protein
MNRPITVANLLQEPNIGPQSFEGSHAQTLETQFNNSLTSLFASLPQSPYVVNGWDIVGGGGGAAWRASYDVGLNPGWGLNTSPPLGLTRVVFKEVKHARQMRPVVWEMLASLPATAYVWSIKYAASGRDGTYLVGILYSLDGFGSGHLTYVAEVDGPVGPFVAETTVATLTIPQVISGIAAQQREYAVHYGLLLNDTTGAAGVIARLKGNGVTYRECQYTTPATDWVQFAGCKSQNQLAGADVVMELTVDVVGANVSARGAHIHALVVNSAGAES